MQIFAFVKEARKMYNLISELCKAKGTTITKLCEEVTGSSGNLATWKKGYMRSDYLLKVAQRLDVSVDYLLGYEENPRIQKLIEFASRLTDEQLDGFIETYSKLLDSLKK